MMYLNYEQLGEFLKRYYGLPKTRLVGITRSYDSGYFDIVRFFGQNALRPNDIKISYLPGRFELTDSNIQRFAQKIAQELRQQGRIYEGPGVARVADADFAQPPYYLTLQFCDYGNFAGSCFALDYPDPMFEKYGGTLREYYKINYPSSDFETFPLAACLGICGVLMVEKANTPSEQAGQCLLVRRSGHLASLENSTGPSAAGSVDFVAGYENLHQLINASLGQEIREELHLEPDEYSIVPLAFAREIFRGEIPQLFCLIKTKLNQHEIINRLESITDNREFDRYQFVDLKKIIGSGQPEKADINHEALMNCHLIDEFLAQA